MKRHRLRQKETRQSAGRRARGRARPAVSIAHRVEGPSVSRQLDIVSVLELTVVKRCTAINILPRAGRPAGSTFIHTYQYKASKSRGRGRTGRAREEGVGIITKDFLFVVRRLFDNFRGYNTVPYRTEC